MSGTWYPVIDYVKCTECGKCAAKCTHGVYDKAKAPCPVVVRPEACIQNCRGCGSLCPQGAISYVGDVLHAKPKTPAGAKKTFKRIAVDFLYLDLNTCSRCKATDTAVKEAAAECSGVLRTLGYAVTVNSVNITSAEMAEEYRFRSSPTIRVNGRDICPAVEENNCADCGDICGSDTDCRMFVWKGKKYNQPPKAMVTDAILRAVYRPRRAPEQEEYRLPENLKKFFKAARKRKKKDQI